MFFVVTCWERDDLLALVCGVYCELVTFPLVSWVRCGTWLYRFLIFAPLLTLLYFTLIQREIILMWTKLRYCQKLTIYNVWQYDLIDLPRILRDKADFVFLMKAQITRTRNIFKKDIRRLSNTDNFNTNNWRNPLIPPVFACWKRMFHLKPANLEVVVMFLVYLLLYALFAERYASESFQIVGTSPAKAREQCYKS